MGTGGQERIRRHRTGRLGRNRRTGGSIPRSHPGKITTFVDCYGPDEEIESILTYWLQRRSSSQYVDIRGAEINVPHEQFGRDDADRILEEAATVIEYVRRQLDRDP